MLEKIQIYRFKSIEELEFDPGLVNVLVGANGSGKSNLLEAIGVLSAAASGRVDDETLQRRGVRPGVPDLYKCAFRGMSRAQNISFGASNVSATYNVALANPMENPRPAWHFRTENLVENGDTLAGRPDRTKRKLNPEAGLAALKLVDLAPKSRAASLLRDLRNYGIYSPNTNVLRGIAADSQQLSPIGLEGGRLPDAVRDLRQMRKASHEAAGLDDDATSLKGIAVSAARTHFFVSEVLDQALSLIDWAKSFYTAPASAAPLSRSVTSPRVIAFRDRFMRADRNVVTGYDASEGALYVLFHAVLAAHSLSPSVCAVDNADHALNPRLVRSLFRHICEWHLNSPLKRQIFLTTHNPAALDGLPLNNESVRLFTVSRTDSGRTTVRRVVVNDKLRKMAKKGWTLSRLWVAGHLGGVPDVF